MNFSKITVPTPHTQTAPHTDVLRSIRSCKLATEKLAKLKAEDRGVKHEEKSHRKYYKDLFYILFNRLPTKEEMHFMVGGFTPTCTKCNKEIAPNNNGTLRVVCLCEKEDL